MCMSTSKEHILIACNDGSVRKIEISKGLYLVEQYSKIDSGVTSISAFADKKGNDIVVTGHKNGSIIKWVNGKIESTFGNKAYQIKPKGIKNETQLSIEQAAKNEEDKEEIDENEGVEDQTIWRIAVVSSKYIATGNSGGSLQIWDLEFGVLSQQFRESNSDILAIEFNQNNKSLYYTGCDSTVYSLHFIEGKFKISSKIRPQSHDIHSLCLLNDSLLLVGGVTTDICLVNLVKGRFIEKFDKKTNSKFL